MSLHGNVTKLFRVSIIFQFLYSLLYSLDDGLKGAQTYSKLITCALQCYTVVYKGT
jgi:hypothetical protein